MSTLEIEEVCWNKERGSLIDLDIGQDGATFVATIKKNGLQYLFWNEMEIKLPGFLDYPCVRFIDDQHVLVVDRRTIGKQENAAVFSSDGRMTAKFLAGDGIQDIGCRSGIIFFTYFDEGVFSGIPPSEEGVAIFNTEGKFITGFREKFGPRIDIVDCYCACWGNGESMWFCSYTKFPLVEWNLRKNTISILKLPDQLHYPSSMSASKGTFYFYSPKENRNSILEWKPGLKPKEVGVHGGPLRGMSSGRFLFVDEHVYKVLKIQE